VDFTFSSGCLSMSVMPRQRYAPACVLSSASVADISFERIARPDDSDDPVDADDRTIKVDELILVSRHGGAMIGSRRLSASHATSSRGAGARDAS
jgi:hypothetical protein